jgi:AcrR family transcriptional regulator
VRRDAQENRERILEAAEAVFGRHGAAGSTEEVARLAGVGVATVFRHFPTKEALAQAALVSHFTRLTAQATTLAEDPDAGSALRALVHAMVDDGATKLTLASVAKEGDLRQSGVIEAATQLRSAMDIALRRAQDSGTVRASVTVDEVYLLIRGLAQASATAAADKKTLDRAVEIVLAGLTAP